MQTMRRLTESRPVDTNRQEFFTDAEIFACIVTIQLVGPSGDAFVGQKVQYLSVIHLANASPLLLTDGALLLHACAVS